MAMVIEQPAPQAEIRPIAMLHIFPSFGYGGQQARFAELVRGLGAGFRHQVMSLDGDMAATALLGERAPVSYQSFSIGKTALATFANLKRFQREIATAAPDILCTYNWGSVEAALANLLGARLPHIHFEDGFGPDEKPDAQLRRRVLMRRVALSKSIVVLPSFGLTETAARVWKLKPEQIRHIPNGVDFDRLQDVTPGLSAQVQIGTVGAIRPEKNHARLIKAFIAADPKEKAALTIIGDGPERMRMIALVKELRAQDRISLPGATDTPQEAYNRFDIFAMSSDTEQAPLSLMEAMAAGLPIAATNVGDIAQMVSNENRAFITPLGDDDAYAYSLAQLLQNPTLRAQLGAANRQKAKAEFSLDKMIDAHRALYLSVTAHG